MLGTLRLCLALAVAASHLGYRIAGINPGVSAVVGFYLISGYVMAGLLARHYPRPRDAGAFYLDRAARLMPQYLFYALLVLLWYRLTPSLPDNPSLAYHLQGFRDLRDPHAPPGLLQYLQYLDNLLLIPLNYYMWNGSDRFTLIPPPGPSRREVQFYLLAPFVLGGPRRILGLFLPALLTLGLALLGQIQSDWFGYRLHPGILVYFFLGALLQHLHRRARPKAAWGLVGLTLLAALLATLLAARSGSLVQPYNREILLGLGLTLPLLQGLAQRPRHPWDELAGNLSYGVFLNHFLLYWALFPAGVPLTQLPAFFALSLLLAWASQRYIERPCLALRHRLRARRAP